MKKHLLYFIVSCLAFGGCAPVQSESKNRPDPSLLTVSCCSLDAGRSDDVIHLRTLLEQNHADLAALQKVDRNTLRNPLDQLAVFTEDSVYTDSHYTRCFDFEGGQTGTAFVSVHPILESKDIQLYSADFSGDQTKEELIDVYASYNPKDPQSRRKMDALQKKHPVEPRSVSRCLIDVDGKKTAFYTIVLSSEDSELRKRQMNTVRRLLDEDPAPYKIAAGNFNAALSTKEYSVFEDRYQIANGKDGVWLDTCQDGDDSRNVDCLDNVIVSRNMMIEDVYMVPSALSDHNPLFVALRYQ